MQKRWQFVSRQEEKAASATGVEVGDVYTLKKTDTTINSSKYLLKA